MFCDKQDGELKAIDFDSACSLSGGVASREPDIAENVGPRFDVDHVLTPRCRTVFFSGRKMRPNNLVAAHAG